MLQLLRDRTWMLFVDGENFTKRGQAVLKAASVLPTEGPAWQRDVFLWPPRESPRWLAITRDVLGLGGGPSWRAGDLRRSYYYTSRPMTGDPEWTETQLAIRAIGFEPRLFRRREGKSKAVDIALTTDVLTFAAAGQYEVAVIVSDDGDYVPLVEAVKRLGLHVGVASFTDCSPQLRIAADDFVDLSEPLVEAWQAHYQTLAWEAEQAKRAGEGLA